mgnify:FL=1
MARIVIAVALAVVLIGGIGWFSRTPGPGLTYPESSQVARSVSPAQTTRTLRSAKNELEDRQPATAGPPRRLMARQDFLELVAGDRVALRSSGGPGGFEKHIVTIDSVGNASGNRLITGLVEGGGGFIATLGPTSLNIFLQSEKGALRYAGTDFKGELSRLQVANLANDIRLPRRVQERRLETSIETPVAQDATQ